MSNSHCPEKYSQSYWRHRRSSTSMPPHSPYVRVEQATPKPKEKSNYEYEYSYSVVYWYSYSYSGSRYSLVATRTSSRYKNYTTTVQKANNLCLYVSSFYRCSYRN
eukprot:scaffold231512_cov36-Prasinocladus_malaysianus.AAC.1